jgi:hypothetical protein
LKLHASRNKKEVRTRGVSPLIDRLTLFTSISAYKALWMPALPAPDSLSAMSDIWPTTARFSTFSPESENPFSSSPGYSNGNLTTARTMSDQSGIDSFKDRHHRLMSTENEKNKLIEVAIETTSPVKLN